jgi:tRNA(Ile)-lysidine synthase
MPDLSARPVSLAEAKALFAGLEDLPALVLAVSGGPDSTALMLLAARWRDALKAGPKLVAVTIDHGLRKEAKREAAAVARLARKLRVAHRTLRWSGRKPATGLQQAARAARYRLLAQAARQAHAAHILTAHTLDDQAETVLIRMSRGSGLTGLAAMQGVAPLPAFERAPSPACGGGLGRGALLAKMPPPGELRSPSSPASGGGEEKAARAAHQGLLILRPLLDIPKARLIATLKAAKIPYAEDPSNRDPRFMRVRLRGLMAALAGEGLSAARLAQLARRLKRADQALEAATDRAAADLAVQPMVSGGLAFDAAGFARLPAEIGLRLLGRAVAKLGDEGPVELAKLESLKTALETAQNAGAARFRRSLAGALVTLREGQIVVERAPPRRTRTLTTGGRSQAGKPKTR